MVSTNEMPPSKRPSGAPASVKQTPTLGATDFGPTLRRFREARRLTREQLSSKSGLSVEAIGRLERGEHRQPRRDSLDLLADALTLSTPDRIAFEVAAGYLKQEEDPPIGREREWERLQRELSVERPLIVISGEPGFGKSHLLEAAARWASAFGWQVLSGGCHRNSKQEPYAPITEAIKESVRALPIELQRANLRGCSWLARLLPELLEDGVLEVPRQKLSEDQERRLMFDAVVRYHEQVGGGAGTLLVLDDLQWAGSETMPLLAHVLRAARSAHIRCLVAYRTTEVDRDHPLAELVADLAKDDRVARVELAPLTRDDASRLASELLSPVLEQAELRVRRQVIHRLVERADGIPLFVVHFARALRELAIEREEHAARAATPSDGPSTSGQAAMVTIADLDRIPWSSAQYVYRLVHALPPSARALLQVAAIAVEARSGEVLAECLGRSESDLLPDLQIVRRSGLLRAIEPRTGIVVYRFTHELLREAVEVDEELDAGQRMHLHRGLGAALERRLSDYWRQREDLYPWLAYHFARSGQPEQAARYLRIAGDQARRMYAHQQAARYYAELVTFLDELRHEREAADARRDMADELAHMGRYAEAVDVLARASGAYRKLRDMESVALAAADIASAHINRGTRDAGLAEFVPIVAEIGIWRPDEQRTPGAVSPAVQAQLLRTLSYLYFMDGQYAESLRAAEHALDIAQTMGDATLIGHARCRLGASLFALGRAPEAAETLRLSIACLETTNSPELLIESLLMAIWVAQTQGDFARSHELQQRALTAAQEFGNLSMIGHAFIFVGLLAFYRGDWDQAQSLAMSSAGAFGEVDGSPLGSYPSLGLGWLCLLRGKRDEAMRHLEKARSVAESSDGEQVIRLAEELLAEDELVRGHGDEACARLIPVLEAGHLQERTRIELQTLRAWGALQMGHVAEAEALALDAVQSASGHEMCLLLPDALRVWALCAIEQHDRLAAIEAVANALVLCKRMPYPYAEAKVRHVYGQLCLAMGETDLARAQFEQALDICEALGEHMYRPIIKQALEPLKTVSSTG
jgi:predicted ATPase